MSKKKKVREQDFGVGEAKCAGEADSLNSGPGPFQLISLGASFFTCILEIITGTTQEVIQST